MKDNIWAVALVIFMFFLFIMGISYLDKHFKEDAKIKQLIYLQNTAPKVIKCKWCGYSGNAIEFFNGICPVCKMAK